MVIYLLLEGTSEWKRNLKVLVSKCLQFLVHNISKNQGIPATVSWKCLVICQKKPKCNTYIPLPFLFLDENAYCY